MLTDLLRTRLRPYRRTLMAVLVLQSIQTAAALMLPALNSDIINKGVLTGDTGYIRSRGLLMLGFALVQAVFSICAIWLGAKVAMGFGRDLRGAMFHRVTSFSAREIGTFGAPSLITRITNDVQQVQMLVVMTVTMAVTAPITMVVGVLMAVRLDVGLSLVVVVVVPLAGVVLGTMVSRMVPAYRAMSVHIDTINQVVREQISGIRVVRAFVREPEERERFARANDDVTATALTGGRLMTGMFPTVNLFINLASVAVLWIGADRVSDGIIAPGEPIAFLSYLVQILMSVVMLTFTLSMIPRASVSAGRLAEVLRTESSVELPGTPIIPTSRRGELELKSVGFHYPGAAAPVLNDISLRISPGQTTAVVGSTGSGKTTLVNLMLRLFDATSGQVLLDGVDVRDLAPEALWSRVSMVPQRPYLFSGTVASNLRYGKPDATEAEMWAALEVAQAADFVRAMPDGIDARIDQGGANVSGGQRQRLSIARALVARPAVYVFDDSLSALDLTTDARLRAALVPWTADAAVVIVAQRVSTIMAADQIVVLEHGELVGLGTHDQLLADCPTYAEIVMSQLDARGAR